MSSPSEKRPASAPPEHGNKAAVQQPVLSISASPAPTYSAPPGTLLFSIDLNSLQMINLVGDPMSVLGISEQACGLHGSLIRAHLHPDDRYRIETLLEASLANGSSFVATYRWTRPDTGRVMLLTCRANTVVARTTLDGIITDITESAVIGTENELASTTLGNNLSLMGVQGLTLSLALVVQTISAPGDLSFLNFGFSDFTKSRLTVGGSLLSCFAEPTSKSEIQAFFEQALSNSSGKAEIEREKNRLIAHVIPSTTTPEGYLLYALPITEEISLRREVVALNDRVCELEKASAAAPALLNLSQEILGYAALIQKHSGDSPFLKHISHSLVSTVRDLSTQAREITAPFQNELDTARQPQPLIRSRRASEQHVLMFASDTKSVRHLQAALLSDAGLSTLATTLDPETLKASLRNTPSARVLIVDVPGKGHAIARLIRGLRKLFPDVYVVCLVPGSPQSYPELQHSGAILVLCKPLTAHELVRVNRGLLHLAAAMTLSDQPSPIQSNDLNEEERSG